MNPVRLTAAVFRFTVLPPADRPAGRRVSSLNVIAVGRRHGPVRVVDRLRPALSPQLAKQLVYELMAEKDNFGPPGGRMGSFGGARGFGGGTTAEVGGNRYTPPPTPPPEGSPYILESQWMR